MDNTLFFSFYLSFKVAIMASMLSFLIGTPIAYLMVWKNFTGKNFLNTIIMLPLILPPTIMGYYLILAFGKHGLIGSFLFKTFGITLIFKWYAAVIASFIVSLPLMIKSAQSSFLKIDKNLIDAAHTLGLTNKMTFIKVILPLSKNGLIAGFVLSFARALGEFGATLMFAGNIPGKTDTIPLKIYALTENGEIGKANNIALIYIILAISIIYFSDKLLNKKGPR
jgi:molybdate transport system permease protein